MTSKDKGCGYKLDGFVVQSVEVDDSEVANNTKGDIDGHDHSGTPKKPKASDSLVRVKPPKKSSEEDELLYAMYDSESLDALLRSDTQSSQNESDFSNFEETMKEEKRKAAAARAKARSRTVTPKKPLAQAARVVSSAESSPYPSGTKRSRGEFAQDNEAVTGDTGRPKRIITPSRKGGLNADYRKLVEMFGISPSPTKKRK